ncbi:hypothetical protein [Ralstonia sp.]|uniref:hypothetical protein n=1 Tax=Ralstonia sp. TaxID=54061 RepID=UPI0031DA5D1D
MRDDSSSSSTSSSTNNTDRRVVNDHGLTSGDGSTITANVSNLDGGAIASAFDFAKAGSENAFKSTQDAIGLANNTVAGAAALQKNASDGLLTGLGKLLDFARSTADNAKTISDDAQKNVAAAYQNVQEISTGQKFMVAGALAIAGIVAVSKMKG